jgi:hypothetical protein
MTKRLQSLLAAYAPLVDPVSAEPLSSGDFLEIYLGYRQLPISLPRQLSQEEAEALSERLADWLDRELQAAGLGARAAGLRLQAAWSGEASGGKRLVRVLAGLEAYTTRQMLEDWECIAAAVGTVLGKPLDPGDLVDAVLTEEAQASPRQGRKRPRAKAGKGSGE